MQHWARLGAFVSLCFFILAFLFVNQSYAQTDDPRYYDIGNPTVVDIFLDPVNGNDANDGSSRASALKTLQAAWYLIPYDTVLSTGYRINILPGVLPCASYCSNWFAQRYGTYQFPIIIRAADGRGTVTIQGGLNFYSVNFLYLIDLNIVAGNGVGAFSNNVIHFDRVYHLLMRGLTLTGLNPVEFQEVVKANQCQVIYLEDSDISGARSSVVDFFAVQWGHIVNNRIHDSGSWGMYLKGGSAYFRIEGNEIYNCLLGFSAGEGSTLSYLEPPFLHYEVYDIKFINNVLHDLPGTALMVAGGYNVLLAHNTLYRIGYASPRSYGLFTVSHGGRVCYDTDGSCKRLTDQGAWGPSQLEDAFSSYVIPNRNVFIYNNVFYNPAPYRTADLHMVVYGAAIKPATFQNLPDYLPTDENLQIRGNVIWNGPSNTLLGIEYDVMGCKPSNPTCNADQLRADNTINVVEPQFRDPANEDFHLLPDSNLAKAVSLAIPDFGWADAPSVPLGNLSNSVGRDRDNSTRAQINPPGAYTIPAAVVPAANSAAAVSAASYRSPVAAESLVAAFGVNLSPTTATAATSP
ncbi:MAG: right-handed parallel beta-helix repeat-containing protein, partial [Acidobacteria bacterium]|nr:right-handed parallel beta-helix repeat-containing protein [Acidobacteriota bacterium]